MTGAQPEQERQTSAARPAPALFGRVSELKAVQESNAPVLLLTGDSGIGKSELLRAAQAAAGSGAAPSPVTLARPRGSLQRALLQGLADATAELVRERGRAKEVAERLAAAAKKLGEEKGLEFAKVIARALLLKLRDTVGADAVDVVTEYVRDLSDVSHETLLERILAAADPSVTDILVGLATEVVDLAGARGPVVLSFDGAEILHEDDRALLADLADRLPDGLQIRVGFGTWSEEHRAHAEDLRAATGAIHEMELQGLAPAGIRSWLLAQSLDGARAEEVFAATQGYPIWVLDEVAELEAGHAVGSGEPQQQFRNRTQLAWRALDSHAQAVARQLAVFDAPLPEEVLRDVCGLSAADWGTAIDRLQRARILSTIVNGVPWFHPRRQDVVRSLLRENERELLDAAAERALQAYLGYVESAGAPELTANIAQLAAVSPMLVERRPGVRAATELDATQLAILAALVEIFEPRSHPVDANYVLQHAREFFSGEGDLIPALEALVESGLVQATSNQHGVFVQPALEEPTTRAVIQGRALLELGRLPLPGLASSVFSAVLEPRIAPFVNCVYGFGVGSMREAVENATQLGLAAQLPGVGGRGQGHFLIIRSRFHGRPLSATVRFQTPEYQATARGRLNGLALSLFGGRFEVVETLTHPDEAIAASRFIRVVERALGYLLNVVTLKLEMNMPYAIDEYMRLRAETFSFIHSRCSPAERRAFTVEMVPSIHWHVDERYRTLVHGLAFGGEPRAIRHDDIPLITFADPYSTFRYAQAFGLREGERLRHLTHIGGRALTTEPVVDVIRELRDRALQVTRHQKLVRIPVDLVSLEARIREARRRQLADARALAARVTLDGGPVPEPKARTLFVSIYAAPEIIAGRLDLKYLELTKERGEEEVHVSNQRVQDGTWDQTVEAFREVFNFEELGEPHYAGSSGATTGVAALLGYEEGDIMLVDTQGRPADAF